MGFWKNVDDELKYQGKERKELAAAADFDVSYIGKGIRRDSVPAADLAVRIAKALDVSLEYLLEMPESSAARKKESPSEINKAIRLYHKFDAHLKELEKLSAPERALVLSLMKTINAARKN
ncbi:MAG: helix-turn-helix domain-containing protein [Treponema sp.]|nr:helix-turn-helix domain-containing protein [Treponema sp.]